MKAVTKIARKNGNGNSPDFVWDPGSREALERFRKAADANAERATKTRETAIETLISDGIYTRSGKLSRHYR